MEKLTGSKLGKEYNKAVYFHSAYLTYMKSTSCEMPGLMTHKVESRLPGEISTTYNMQPCYTPFPILNQSIAPSQVLTVAS